jgi:hypothetical protein
VVPSTAPRVCLWAGKKKKEGKKGEKEEKKEDFNERIVFKKDNSKIQIGVRGLSPLILCENACNYRLFTKIQI